ncbi:SanA/YdcF family protein [Halomonas icarae]|uniref:SanA-like protein n=1 Tax=Halomonas icarae TaxID=2691040 RepID=A0A7X5AKJ1_9GAMM|nr:ElyC/SanA/YdcF family protein [Halomonas icarae]MDR5901536.1 ElyC/SanA/YdcF family protein [Halomonas icarae]NAW11716.1 sanA-like protein [Halomonas icarae]
MKRMAWRILRAVLMALGTLMLMAGLLMLAANLWVLGQTRERIDYHLSQCHAEQVGIVFGTSHWTRSGTRNPYFEGRMSASARLLRLGRVDHLLLSGDNRTLSYNEPITMWRDLRGREVPETAMTLDYAGLSTFDTLARAKAVFGVERALLITQEWHLPRALFIAEALGIEAQGCAVKERKVKGQWRLAAREWVARLATLGDLYLWDREPYFLGPREPLVITPQRRTTDQEGWAADTPSGEKR